MTTESIDRKFDVKESASLTLANISGKVDIQCGDDGVITIAALKHDNGNVERTRIDLEQHDNGDVLVKTDYSESFWRSFGQHPCDVDYTVRVPRNTALTLRVVSSSAVVAGLTGRFDINAVSGDLVLSSLTGPIKINQVSGALNAEGLSGAGDITTVSGKTMLAACNFPSLKLSTVSGDITAETPMGDGPYDFHSVSGDVRLHVQSGASCTVDYASLSGRVVSDLPTTFSQQTGRRRTLALQGGGNVKIKFDSISANLHIQSASGTADAAVARTALPLIDPVVPLPTPTPDVSDVEIAQSAKTRQDILDRVAQGRLSVDDAVNLLRG